MSRAPSSQCAGQGSRWSSSRRCRGCAWQTSGSPRRAAPTPRRRRCGSPRVSSPAACRPSWTATRCGASSSCQHAPRGWRDWQTECRRARACRASGRWAGETLGRLHSATAGDAEVAAAFGDYEAFAQLRLEPNHGVVMERLRPGPCAGAARRRAARHRRAWCTATTHPRTSCSVPTARGRWTPRSRTTATRSSTSRSSWRSRY